MADIEESCLFLIQLAKSASLDLDKILNQATKSGQTLFSNASAYSEKTTKQLLTEANTNEKKIIKVNTIEHNFVAPSFRVRLKTGYWK